VKTTFLKKLAVLAGSIAMAAVGLVVVPVTSASAAPRPTANFAMNLGNSGMSQNNNNSTGVFDVPQGAPSVQLSMNISASSTVATGPVVANDVITVTTSLVNAETNAPLRAYINTGDPEDKDFLGQRNMNGPMYNWNFPRTTELVRTHKVTAADITAGWFANNTFSSQGSINTPAGCTVDCDRLYNDYGFLNYSFVRVADVKKVKLNIVWKKNGTVLSSVNNFYLNVWYPFNITAEGTVIDSESATSFFDQTSGQYLNSGGCIDTTGLSVGDVLEVDYTFTVDGKRPEVSSNFSNSVPSMTWNVSTNMGAPGGVGQSGTVYAPGKISVYNYRFTSATTADIVSFSLMSSGYRVGDKVKFTGTQIAAAFPASEYTVTAVNTVSNTITISGSGWTAGNPQYIGGNNFIEPSVDSATSTFSMTLTQTMIDGYVVGTNKTNLLGVNAWQQGILIKAGRYVFDVKAHKKGETTNRATTCSADDVVNLTSTKNANGETVITFQEQSGSKYSAATGHFCQLKTTAGGTVPVGTWIGGVPAMEVTPSTTPKTFKCVVGALEDGASYQLALGNYIGMGWNNTLQTTWVTFKNAPDVSTDATLTSAGIGTATAETAFDPAKLTYSVTSKDLTTPYPNVVTSNSKSTYVVKLNGTVVPKGTNLNLKNGANVVTIEVSSPSGAKKTYTFNVNKVDVGSDATLSSLSFGSETLSPAFSSETTTYSASVSSTTTTYPFPSYGTTQDGSTVVVKNGSSTVTGPGALSLVDGLNVVTVEVTAPNGTTKKTYTMNITKQSAAKDATLSALPSVAGVTSSPSFDADVTSYTGNVSESTTTVALTAGTTNVNGATVVYKLNGLVVTPPVDLKLRPGANTLETIVTSSDGTTTKTYTQTITRAVVTAGSSTGANDARLAESTVPGVTYVAADGQTVTGFDPEVTQYTKQVPVNQTEVSVLAGGTANSNAIKTVEYSTDGGATWISVTAPGTVPLAAGKTTKIKTKITNGRTKEYITDVIRPAEDPNAEVGPTEGDGDTAPKGITGTKGKFVPTNDTTFQVSWDKTSGKLDSQATGIYIGYIEATITFTKGGKNYTCSAQFGTTKALPAKTAAQKTAAMKMKTFKGKQFCMDKTKLDPRTTAPAGGFTTANFKKIKPMNKTAAELTQEKAALAALKGFTGQVNIQVVRYRAWPSTMVNLGNWDSKGGKISVQIRNTKVNLG